MRLAAKEILIILEALREQHGIGYSKIPEVGRLQARLSIMLEVALKQEQENPS